MLSVPAIFLLIKTESDLLVVAIIQTAIPLLTGLYLSFYIYKKRLVRNYCVTVEDIIGALKDSSIIFVGSLAIFLYTMSAPLILGFFANYYEVGIYSAADKLKAALLGVFLILGNAFYPRVNALFKESHSAGFKFIRKMIVAQILLGFSLSLIHI